MRKFSGNISVVNMRDTYHELGRHEFKIVLNPKKFKNYEGVTVKIIDSDGKNIPNEIKFWGVKINCVIDLDDNVADGVATVYLEAKDQKIHEMLTFWVIK